MSAWPILAVTLNWNLERETAACIESILAAGLEQKEIILVDNGSRAEGLAALREDFPAVNLVPLGRNLGFAGGMNAGIRAGLERGAASLLLLNNDTVLDPAMIRTLAAAAERPEGPGILGPAIYYYDQPERLWKLGDVRRRGLPMPRPVKMRAAEAASAPPLPVDYVTGCGMLVRRQVFEQIGLFDERYFMYFEDADLCRRARDAGFQVWCVPQARMWHKISATARRDRPRNRYHRALNQVRFYHEHPHGPWAPLREVYIGAKVLKTALEDAWHGDWQLLGPLWRGTRDGYVRGKDASFP
jgi:GT2 family glycosyltransferase